MYKPAAKRRWGNFALPISMAIASSAVQGELEDFVS